LDTKRTLPGSRRRFGVNMGYSNKDRILIENLYRYDVKGYGAKNEEFPNKGWD